MVLLVRVILISLIVYLLIRPFVRYFEDKGTSDRRSGHDSKNEKRRRGVSKEVGEYIDYEEVD